MTTSPPRRTRNSPGWLWGAVAVVLLGIGVALLLADLGGAPTKTLSYSAFVDDIDARNVSTVSIAPDGTVTGTLASRESFTSVIPVGLADHSLLDKLAAADVTVTAIPTSAGSFWSSLTSWLLILIPIVLIVWVWRRMARAGGQGFGLGITRSPAKLFTPSPAKTTFADVAGYEGVKAEISEIADFLRNPERYRRLGAATPRGVLLIGPPGTGKTMLARAIAGESGVSFFSVDGSSFVEMFVGVGASRVRELFTTVRKNSPAILFIDEIDAIGQRRSGVNSFVSNDERDQTLNQLLAEMDGFEASTGIVVLAATNRPDVLDPALLRPGRFDRHITVPLPNATERAQILAAHCQGKPLDPRVDLDAIARSTPGFSGADLANLANEAAIEAVRDGRERITGADFGAARDRLILGRRDSTNALLGDEKRQVATHESGHALVAALSPHADPVDKITILPAGETLGATEQLPLVERHLRGEAALDDLLATQLAGRAAELVVYGEGSTGAANDLAAATEVATRMVREFGLSPAVGPVGYPTGDEPATSGTTFNRPFSEATQRAVDTEVSRLLREAQARAIELITANRPTLDTLIDRLIDAETLDGSIVYQLLGKPVPKETADFESLVAPASDSSRSARDSRQAHHTD